MIRVMIHCDSLQMWIVTNKIINKYQIFIIKFIIDFILCLI